MHPIAVLIEFALQPFAPTGLNVATGGGAVGAPCARTLEIEMKQRREKIVKNETAFFITLKV